MFAKRFVCANGGPSVFKQNRKKVAWLLKKPKDRRFSLFSTFASMKKFWFSAGLEPTYTDQYIGKSRR